MATVDITPQLNPVKTAQTAKDVFWPWGLGLAAPVVTGLFYFHSLASWMHFWCWNSWGAMACWKASASAVRASPTGLSSKSSGNGEPAGVGGVVGSDLEKAWMMEMCWATSVLYFKLWDPGSERHPQRLHGWKASLHSHGELNPGPSSPDIQLWPSSFGSYFQLLSGWDSF